MADQWDESGTSNVHARDEDDDDVPDEWDAEPVEKPKKSEVEEKPKPLPSTKNKQTKKKYAGDQRGSDDEFLESLKEPDRQYTAEELEELRQRADLQQEQLKLKMATDFLTGNAEQQTLDNVNLLTKEEFLDYSFRLHNRLALLSKSEHYLAFLDDILIGLTKPISVEGVKRLSGTLQGIITRKQNEKREEKSKIKKNVKPQLKADRRNAAMDSFIGDGIEGADVDAEYDEDNDFM